MIRRRPRTPVPAAAALALLLTSASAAAAQDDSAQWLERCREGRMNRDRVTHCEVRESTMAAPSRLEIDSSPNGGIEVRGASRSDVHVVARVQAWAPDEAEAREIAGRVQVEASGSRVRATGPRFRDNRNAGWSVSFVLATPQRMDLTMSTVNGGIGVRGVTGSFDVSTTNGGIRLDDVGGSVRARTTNGGIDTRLAGARWAGEALDLQTTNGGIVLHVPEGFAADVSARTSNGGIHTDFPLTVQGRWNRSLEGQLGGGGPPLRMATTNGGIQIRQR